MGIHYFPCQFVYWRKIKNHAIFKKRILSIIETNKTNFKFHSLVTDGLSSYSDDKNDNYNKFNLSLVNENKDIINEVVWDSIDELIEKLNSRDEHAKVAIESSKIGTSWISIYNKNSIVGNHSHNTSYDVNENGYIHSFVLVYIVNDESKTNATEFLQPTGQLPTTSYKTEYRFYTQHENEIREGTVMIFPSNLYHHVNQIKTDNRVVYTFNIFSKFYK
jgi:hypothetical protein